MDYDRLAADYARHRGAYPPVVEALTAPLPPGSSAAAAGLVADDDPVVTEHPHVVSDASSYRDRAHSSLHLIPGAEFDAGLERLWAVRPER